jgi:hypothetical protein
VDTQFDFDERDRVLTITMDAVVLQIRVGDDDLSQLRGAEHADWSAREGVRVGQVLGNPVHWSGGDDPDTVNLMVGPDDELWDVLVVLPAALVAEIAALET